MFVQTVQSKKLLARYYNCNDVLKSDENCTHERGDKFVEIEIRELSVVNDFFRRDHSDNHILVVRYRSTKIVSCKSFAQCPIIMKPIKLTVQVQLCTFCFHPLQRIFLKESYNRRRIL